MKVIIIFLIVFLCGSCKKKMADENIINEPFEEVNSIEILVEKDSNQETIKSITYDQKFTPTHWTTDNLRLRDSPNIDAKVLKTLQSGTLVQKLSSGEEETIDGITANWIFVKTKADETGWCFGGYLDQDSFIFGFWSRDENERNFYYFSKNKKYLRGKFNTDDLIGGDWFIEDKYIHINKKFDPIMDPEKNVTEKLCFEIIDFDYVRINDIIYKRIS